MSSCPEFIFGSQVVLFTVFESGTANVKVQRNGEDYVLHAYWALTHLIGRKFEKQGRWCQQPWKGTSIYLACENLRKYSQFFCLIYALDGKIGGISIIQRWFWTQCLMSRTGCVKKTDNIAGLWLQGFSILRFYSFFSKPVKVRSKTA